MTESGKPAQQQANVDKHYVFRLYVATGAPHSIAAVANLRQICEEFLPGEYEIRVIDVLTEPFRALEDRVLVTPTLIKIAPPPLWRMTGDLSARAKVVAALGLGGDRAD